MKLKPYDIILCKNNKTLVQKIIRKVTNNVYTHSEIYVGNYHIIDDTLQGVKVRNFDSTLGQFDVYRYHRELTEKEKYDIEEFLQRHSIQSMIYGKLSYNYFTLDLNKMESIYVYLCLWKLLDMQI